MPKSVMSTEMKNRIAASPGSKPISERVSRRNGVRPAAAENVTTLKVDPVMVP